METKSRTHYTSEEIYNVILAAQSNPGKGYNSETFWKHMISQYGNSHFNGRTPAGLRQKWRTMIKSLEEEDLYDVNKHLEKMLRNETNLPIKEINYEKPESLMETRSEKDWQDEPQGSIDENCDMSDIEYVSEGIQCDLPPLILVQLSQKYSFPLDQLVKVLYQVSGNVFNLENYLKGMKVVMWTGLEDMALIEGDQSAMYRYILGCKGITEVQSRKQYLGIA